MTKIKSESLSFIATSECGKVKLDVFVRMAQQEFDIQDPSEEAVIFNDLETTLIKIEMIKDIHGHLDKLFKKANPVTQS